MCAVVVAVVDFGVCVCAHARARVCVRAFVVENLRFVLLIWFFSQRQ